MRGWESVWQSLRPVVFSLQTGHLKDTHPHTETQRERGRERKDKGQEAKEILGKTVLKKTKGKWRPHSKRGVWVRVHVTGSMWQMWCRLISHDCWQAAGNSLLRAKSSGEPLCGEGGRPKIIALYLITLHLHPLASTQRNKIKQVFLGGIFRFCTEGVCFQLKNWKKKPYASQSLQYITTDDWIVHHSRLALRRGSVEPDRAVCQRRISAARAAVVLFCMSSCRRHQQPCQGSGFTSQQGLLTRKHTQRGTLEVKPPTHPPDLFNYSQTRIYPEWFFYIQYCTYSRKKMYEMKYIYFLFKIILIL